MGNGGEFANEHVAAGLAFQIRRLRESRGWSQEELSRRTGKAQATISQWEDPNYGWHTLNTLKVLAAAFDVGLLVRFLCEKCPMEWMVPSTRVDVWLVSEAMSDGCHEAVGVPARDAVTPRSS